MESGEGNIPSSPQAEANSQPPENPQNVPHEVTLRGPVFDYWRTALDGRYNSELEVLQKDGNYQNLTAFKGSQIGVLHDRFEAASAGDGEGAQKTRKIELSRAERQAILDTKSEMPFEAGEGRLLTEMRREFGSAFPSPGILEAVRGVLKRAKK